MDERSGPLGLRYATLGELRNAQASMAQRRQLYALGWSPSHIYHEIRVGRWQPVSSTVVALHNGPLSDVQRHWAGVLHPLRLAVASHESACTLAGLRGFEVSHVQVLTSRGPALSELYGVAFRETRRHFHSWVVHDRTGVPRLDIEHAALLAAERSRSPRRAVGLLAATVQQRLTTAEALARAAVSIRKLRFGKLMLTSLDDIAGGAQSFAEIDIGRICDDYGLPRPERQVVRLDRDGRRRYLDCVWRLSDGRTLVLEIDGSFHLQVGSWWDDMKRERGLVIGGDRVLRCSTLELRTDAGSIVADLMAAGLTRLPGAA